MTKIVVLVSEPVRGRYRVTELPCYISMFILNKWDLGRLSCLVVFK